MSQWLNDPNADLFANDIFFKERLEGPDSAKNTWLQGRLRGLYNPRTGLGKLFSAVLAPDYLVQSLSKMQW